MKTLKTLLPSLVFGATLFALLLTAGIALAQAPGEETADAAMEAKEIIPVSSLFIGLGLIGAGVGAGIAVFGCGFGISRIGANASEAIARQPEAGPRIFTVALLTAAFIEGVSFFGILVCLLIQLGAKGMLDTITGAGMILPF